MIFTGSCRHLVRVLSRHVSSCTVSCGVLISSTGRMCSYSTAVHRNILPYTSFTGTAHAYAGEFSLRKFFISYHKTWLVRHILAFGANAFKAWRRSVL